MKTILGLIAVFTIIVLSSHKNGVENKHFPVPGKAELKSFDHPEEVKEFPLGKVELIKVNGVIIGRATFQPGWRWSTSVQPIAKTKSCVAPHFQYHVSGTLKVQMDDGTVFECKAGDVSSLPEGHDAWVEGDEPVVVVDFQGMKDYAKGATTNQPKK
jgi:hypothetical protein